jgi:hypothetical protein
MPVVSIALLNEGTHEAPHRSQIHSFTTITLRENTIQDVP